MDFVIPDRLEKSFEYLTEAVSSGSSLGKAFLPSLRDYYKKERQAAIDKYGENLRNTAQGLDYTLSRIDYILTRFEQWFEVGTIYHNEDAYIFIDGLAVHITDLENMKKEN